MDGMTAQHSMSWNSRAMPMAGFVLLTLLVGLLGFSFVETSTRQLLEAEARIDAEQWTKDISRQIADLKNIAAGSAPSPATAAYLRDTRHLGRVVSFRIYNAQGILKLRSDDFGKAPAGSHTINTIDREVSPAMDNGAPLTIIQKSGARGGPEYFATTILPVMDEFRYVGWLVVDVDQSGRRALFVSMTTKISLVVGLLLIVASAFGFWYRTKQRANIERTIDTISRHDQLTGLINKSSFLKEVDDRMAADPTPGLQASLILFEASNLASLSQAHGAEADEFFLRATAERLGAACGDTSLLGVAGHNAFALFMGGVTDPMEVLASVKQLVGQLGEPVNWRDEQLSLHIHAGIALSSSDGANAAALMHSAELALHSAQEQGTPGYGFFNPEIAKDTRRRVAVQRAVSAAAASQAFRLDFQPVYSIRTGELNGFEALIRLHDQDLGAVSPAEFIPVAEQLGLINAIGAWCLQEACRVASQWPPHLMVAVNLSPFQFFGGSLIGDVRHALNLYQYPAYRLEVEITEGTLLHDSELVLGQLRVLRDLGVAVALDDFGTGYSSLSYLWKFPFSKIKIDRSFVQALEEAHSAKGILRSIVKLGHGLGLTVTAEGIETGKQLGTLRDIGCDLAQGYLLDRPARVADLAAIIMRNFANGLSRRSRDAASSVPPASKSAA